MLTSANTTGLDFELYFLTISTSFLLVPWVVLLSSSTYQDIVVTERGEGDLDDAELLGLAVSYHESQPMLPKVKLGPCRRRRSRQ